MPPTCLLPTPQIQSGVLPSATQTWLAGKCHNKFQIPSEQHTSIEFGDFPAIIGPVPWIPMWILDASWKKHGKTTTCFDQPRFKKSNHSIKPWRSKQTLKPRNIWFASEKIKPQNPQAPACRSDHPGATGSRIAWASWLLLGWYGI